MLFGSKILDLAVGLVLIYSLLSLVCSWVKERIASLFALRATMLEAGIRNLLSEEFAAVLYGHPLIQGLGSQSQFKGLLARNSRAGRLARPSYIPARTFALALLDIVRKGGLQGRLASQAEAQTEDAGRPDHANGMTDVQDALAQLPDRDLRTVLTLLLDASDEDLVNIRKNVEDWFNDAMDRLSGWYKRRAQVIIAVVAVCVTVLLNVDTLTIANGLWRDDALRSATVAGAEQVAKDSPNANTQQLRTRIDALKVPLGYSSVSRDTGEELPFLSSGWMRENFGSSLQDNLAKLAGLALTAIALSFGAPFWFDLLNSFINLRSTGKPPEN